MTHEQVQAQGHEDALAGRYPDLGYIESTLSDSYWTGYNAGLLELIQAGKVPAHLNFYARGVRQAQALKIAAENPFGQYLSTVYGNNK